MSPGLSTRKAFSKVFYRPSATCLMRRWPTVEEATRLNRAGSDLASSQDAERNEQPQ